MRINSSFNLRGETLFEFLETIVGQESEVLPPLSVHGHIRTLTGDRMAVAMALLLTTRLSGKIDLGRPMSRRVADEITRFGASASLDFVDVTEVPLTVHSGSVELVLADAENNFCLPATESAESRQVVLRELPTHAAAGRLFTHSGLIVSTNTSFLSSFMSGALTSSFESRLVVPILLAQDLSASSISVSPAQVHDVPAERLARIARMLAATEIRLFVKGEHSH